MIEKLDIDYNADKAQKYAALIPQIKSLIQGESDLIANLANIAAALKFGMDFFWVGFYFVKKLHKEEMLVLGPFQGPVACTRIAKDKGVCGSSWATKKIIVVADVELFPGHIACSSESKSEIVLPAMDKNGDVFLVLDIDSDKLAHFDNVDKEQLSKLIQLIENSI